MFGFRKQQDSPQIAAMRERMIRAGRVTRRGLGATNMNTGYRPKAIPFSILAGIYLFAWLGFMFLGEYFPNSHLDWTLPFVSADINAMFFSARIPPLFDGALMDMVFIAALRAALLCLLAALLPFCTKLWLQVRDLAQGNMYVAFWGVTIGLPFLFFFFKDFFGPLLKDVIDIFLV